MKLSNKKDATMTFDEMRKQIGEWLQSDEGERLWDLLTCLRGPDSPSELVNVHSPENSANYKLRRERKYDTVEVIRQKAFFGVVGGSARHHDQDYVVVNPPDEQDHFDRHVLKAAHALGLEVRVKEKEKKLSNKTECEVTINLKKEEKGKGKGGGGVYYEETLSHNEAIMYSNAWQQMVNAGNKLMVDGGFWSSSQYHYLVKTKFPTIMSAVPDYSLGFIGGDEEWWVVLKGSPNVGWTVKASDKTITNFALSGTLPGLYKIGWVVKEGKEFKYVTSTPTLIAFEPKPLGIMESTTPPSTPNSYVEVAKNSIEKLSQKGYTVAAQGLTKTKSSILKDLWEDGKKPPTYVAGPASIFTNDGPLMAYLDDKAKPTEGTYFKEKKVVEFKADMNTQGYDVIIHGVQTHEGK